VTVYVDPLVNNGWRMYGRTVANCHMFTSSIDVAELHALAERIGLKRAWFQAKASTPHYDLTASRRELAIAAGAVPVDRHEAVRLWRERREAIARLLASSTGDQAVSWP
jgi:hypothetical protein